MTKLRSGFVAAKSSRLVQAQAQALTWGLVLAGSLLSGAYAAETPASGGPAPISVPEQSFEAWINPGIYSRHFNRDLNLRENNYGVGVELVSRREHGVMLGEYRNSNDRPTRYVGYMWRPLQWGPDDGLRAGAGVIVAAFDGYPMMRDGGWFPALLPVVSVEYKRVGVNFTIVPGYKDRLHGALAVQAKLRVW